MGLVQDLNPGQQSEGCFLAFAMPSYLVKSPLLSSMKEAPPNPGPALILQHPRSFEVTLSLEPFPQTHQDLK